MTETLLMAESSGRTEIFENKGFKLGKCEPEDVKILSL